MKILQSQMHSKIRLRKLFSHNMAMESHIKGNNKFNKMSTTTVLIRLNYNTDADVIERLNNGKAIYLERSQSENH